jgi:hypothetical protein
VPVASLTTIFKNDAVKHKETDKLVDLFRNRVELKKEFAALRKEKYSLQDRIKQHQGATARAQQQLEHLENLLLDPESVHNVVVFYQLRGLSAYCEGKIERFAEQLKQQNERRVQSKVVESWQERRKRKAELIEGRLGEQRTNLQMLEGQLETARHKLMTMNSFVKLFRGRSLAANVDEIATHIEVTRTAEQEALKELDDVHQMAPPDQQGLDITAKRSINCMILSFVQQLYLRFEGDDLAGMAKEATDKGVGAVRYGDKKECEHILELLNESMEEADLSDDLPEILKKRSRLIADGAKFRHDDDAVPVPSSVSTVFAFGPNDTIHQSSANLLGDNYFGVARVLSR